MDPASVQKHFGSHPLFHVICHLAVRLNIDTGIFLFNWNHDRICFGGRITGCKIADAVRLERNSNGVNLSAR